MSLNVPYSFCVALFSQEKIILNGSESISLGDQAKLSELIQDIDKQLRDDAPFEAPHLDQPAALWGLAVLHWSCHLLINRLESRTQLPDILQRTEPNGSSAEQHWSVDIGLRFLADLILRTSTAAHEDPLITTLLEIGARWPYSSVGTTAIWEESRLQVLTNHPSLRHLLLNRLRYRQDIIHAQHPLIKSDYHSHISLPATTL